MRMKSEEDYGVVGSGIEGRCEVLSNIRRLEAEIRFKDIWTLLSDWLHSVACEILDRKSVV